jgi:hypothetical protein
MELFPYLSTIAFILLIGVAARNIFGQRVAWICGTAAFIISATFWVWFFKYSGPSDRRKITNEKSA